MSGTHCLYFTSALPWLVSGLHSSKWRLTGLNSLLPCDILQSLRCSMQHVQSKIAPIAALPSMEHTQTFVI